MKKVMLMMALCGVAALGVEKSASPVGEVYLPMETSVQRLSVVEEAVLDPWTGMSPGVNALVMAMVERDVVYDLADDTFIWNALYYMIGLNMVEDFRVIDCEDSYLVSKEMVEDCAYALFGDMVSLPKVPQSLADFVVEEEEGYRLAKGDAALVSCLLEETKDLGDGVYVLEGVFVSEPDDMMVLCGFTGTVVKDDGMFGYHFVDLSLWNQMV